MCVHEYMQKSSCVIVCISMQSCMQSCIIQKPRKSGMPDARCQTRRHGLESHLIQHARAYLGTHAAMFVVIPVDSCFRCLV